jgi:hypothetical protein
MLPYTTLYVTPDSFPKSAKANGTANGVTNGETSPSTPTKNQSESHDNPKTPSRAEPVSVKDYSSLLEYPKEHWPPELLSYDLSAVIVHKGEINSGHYVNYAREGKEWFIFDDSKVVLVNESEVLGAEAYLLMYVLKDLAPWAES